MQLRDETITKSPAAIKLTFRKAISAHASDACDKRSIFVLSFSVNSDYRLRPSHGTERINAGYF